MDEATLTIVGEALQALQRTLATLADLMLRVEALEDQVQMLQEAQIERVTADC